MSGSVTRSNWFLLGALLLLTAGVYSRLWGAPPLSWDDGSNIFGNPYYTMHYWRGIFSEPYYGLYVPVTSCIWALLYWLGGGDAWPYRALNIALHLANTTLVFLLLRGLARHWDLRRPLLPVFGAAVFALHPFQTETVAWISGGRDLLAAFFSLGALAVYYARPGWISYLAATLLFAFALLSKPSVVTLPLAVMFVDILLLQLPWKKSFARMLPWLGLSAIATALTRWGQVEHFADTAHWWQRPVLIVDSYRFYLQKMLWPNPLSGNYAHTPEKVLGDPVNLAMAALTLLVAVVLAGIAWRRDRRWLILGVWALLLLPVSGLVPFAFEFISGVADHYNYLAMLGVCAALMLAWGRFRNRRIAGALALILICAWTAATWARLPVWFSDQAFFTDMAKSAPDSYNTAIGMSVVMCQDTKDYDEGLRWVNKALAQHADDILALANRAFCLMHAGRIHEVAEMEFYLDRIDYDSLAANQPTALSSLLASLGAAFIQEGKLEDGFQFLCEAYRILPAEPQHARNLQHAAEILRQAGMTPSCAPPPKSTDDIEDLMQPEDGN